MPVMNRIRVNNVKYNFGTQQYDDFVMRFHGKNTIYDLANGGGKSVLMLLLFQNLIPNCTLDEKQPIEKLFRTNQGSKTIHSLVEWELDPDDIKEEYRFMTTGFCARKAKDSDDENRGKDMASIDYFNYCIFYRSYNENDIVNLPLEQDGNRITYQGLLQYLKDLERIDPGLKVQIFHRKGEYQQFIRQYGLYESQWEIIRGINKTEGHVRTYFETNYKTTRKVIENLLIEEIIEKSFSENSEQQQDMNENMARTLLDIKDKLLELSVKKDEIQNFEHQKELLRVLSKRVEALSDLYEEKDQLSNELLSACQYLKEQVKKQQRDLELEIKSQQSKEQEIIELQSKVACLKVKQDKAELEEWNKQEKEAYEQCQEMNSRITLLKEELDQKMNSNDYFEFRQIKKERDQHQSIIEKAQKGADDYLERLYDYAATKKQFLKERMQDLEQRFEDGKKTAQDEKTKTKASMKQKRELECDLAVAKANQQRTSIELETKKQEMNTVKQKLNLLLIENVNTEFTKKQSEFLSEKSDLEHLKNKNTDIEQQYRTLSLDYMKQTAKLEQLLDKTTTKDSVDKDKLDALMKIYDATEKTSLVSNMRARLEKTMQQSALQKRKLEEINQTINALQNGNWMANASELEEIKTYLTKRRGANVQFGQEYLKEKVREEREELLEHWPFVAQSLVLDHEIPHLYADTHLQEMIKTMSLVPIVSRQRLETSQFPKAEDGFMVICNQGVCHWEQKDLEKRKEEFAEKKQKIEAEIHQSKEYQETILQDYQFVLTLPDESPEKKEQKRKEQQELEETMQAQQMQLEQLEQQQKELFDKIETKTTVLDEMKTEVDQFALLKKEFEQFRKLEKEHNQFKIQVEECTRKEKEVDLAIEEHTKKLKSTQQMNKVLEQQIADGYKDWEAYFVAYDQGRKPLDLGFTEEQLDVEFMSMKKVVEQRSISVEDKVALVKTLEKNMDKLAAELKKRKANDKHLEMLYDRGELFVIPQQEINGLSNDVAHMNLRVSELEFAYNQICAKRSKCEGKIEHGLKQLEELHIEYQDFAEALDEVKKLLLLQKEQLTDIQKEYRQKKKVNEECVDFYKDVKRVVELYHLDQLEMKADQSQAEYTLEQLRKTQRTFEKLARKEEKMRQEFEQYKHHTADTLKELKAFELAKAIQDDVQMPKTLQDMKELSQSLEDMCGYIDLEQNRVEQGIKDMEFLKNNFEKQCIRRCQDVKTQLDRLPRLSKILLDQQEVQMIRLKIPYIAEENYDESMSKYIDEVVKGMESYVDYNEKIRFIRNQLSLKRLFSVIVEDMNKIRLELYKRERIKDQSRYLKYEEAVGSTGQSQGIYIQFLISIINYIANIYSVNTEHQLGKVIFIDNPFGAAKDIYIWEPIFELLKTNQVQLIVPARGATPAITNQFEVNYILGQKIVDGKQQTVVVDYRSQIEKQEMEYQRLEFAQESFDFI